MDTLSVVIVGSGLAGLAAARVLREKHAVTVYERGGPDVATGGQGIASLPNAVKILDSLGFDRARVGSVVGGGLRSYDKTGNLQDDFEIDVKQRFGADWLTHKRSDFREELLRLATSPELPGTPAKMVWNTPVKDLDPEQGLITLGDGSMVEANLFIVADGVHSHLRHSVLGNNDHRPRKIGLTCYRIASSAKDVKESLGHLPEWWNPEMVKGRTNMFTTLDGTNRFITAYPLRNHEYMNLSCIYPTPEKQQNKEGLGSWHADGDHAELLKVFSDFDKSLLKLLEIATEVKVWELQDIDPLPTWIRGRAILIGDAAHAMSPLQGQGANMAIEDAEGMRLFLQPGVQVGDVPHILTQIDAVRRPRASQVLSNTRAANKEASLEDRFLAAMDANFSYNGILDALRPESRV